MNKDAVKRRIEKAIQNYSTASSTKAFGLVPQSLTIGILYEAHVLSIVIEKLAMEENYQITLKNSCFIALKSSPGPINRSYPYFQLKRDQSVVAEIWTDIEFISLSYDRRHTDRPIQKGDYHELDIVVTDRGVKDRPQHSQIWLGVECKYSDYKKSFLKEILGIRRELSLLSSSRKTRFARWPRTLVPAEPNSCLMVYSKDVRVLNYDSPGEVYGIDFCHEVI